MHTCSTLVGLFMTVLLLDFPPSIDAEISYQINSTDNKPDCFKSGINITCFKEFLQPATETLNDTSSSNFLSALWRKINSEAETAGKSRHKRQAGGVPVRREIRAAPYENNFLRYALAVRMLKNHYGVRRDMNTYDILASIHTGSNREHRGSAFFSWHRIYLLLYEAALQAVYGPGVTTPYWDSSLDQAMGNRQSRTILFSNRYFGTPLGRVTEGFFANLPGPRITRAINGPGGLISKNAIAAVLSRRSHSEIVRREQSRYFWEGYHNMVHRWVDGTMASGTIAAFDPIFWCHHAFVDYIWELFRRRITNAPADYPLGFPTHPPNGEMRFNNYRYRPNPPITNREGYSNRYARLRRYDPAPSCQNLCSNSPDLICNQSRGICISREASPGGSAAMGAASGSAFVASDAASGSAFAAPGVALAPVDIAAGMADLTTTVVYLQNIRQDLFQDIPNGTSLNLFIADQFDRYTRQLSVFSV